MKKRLFAPVAKRFTTQFGVKFPSKYVPVALKACLFSAVLLDTSEDWCSLFSERELQINEVVEDVIYYYAHGPGNAINTDLMCEGIQAILRGMREALQGRGKKWILRFNHAETIMHLGLILVTSFCLYDSMIL